MELFCIGGTRFVGRHIVERWLEAGDEVTLYNRGRHQSPFEGIDRVSHERGDRADETRLRDALETAAPDVVVDTVAYQPAEVALATSLCRRLDIERYVYISSGAAYGEERVPKREGETALEPWPGETPTDAVDATYGQRKAQGDRLVAAAAADGLGAMSVRPPVIYGPYDYTERFDYWLARVLAHERVVVPGDGASLWHRAYAGDVASAVRVVAQQGEPGEAYNVGDDHAPTMAEWVELIAAAADRAVEPVATGAQTLATVGLDAAAFPGYRARPHLLALEKLRALGWRSTPHEEGLAATLSEYRQADRDERDVGPARRETERALAQLESG